VQTGDTPSQGGQHLFGFLRVEIAEHGHAVAEHDDEAVIPGAVGERRARQHAFAVESGGIDPVAKEDRAQFRARSEGERGSRPVHPPSLSQSAQRANARLPTVPQAPFDFYFACFAMLKSTAARTSALNAFSSILSPSRMSIARRRLPSKLALKSFDGSFSDAP
jgi:hypothetical protein